MKLIFCLLAIQWAQAGGMGTSSNNEMLFVFLTMLSLVGILYCVNQSLKWWNKPPKDETVNAEKPK